MYNGAHVQSIAEYFRYKKKHLLLPIILALTLSHSLSRINCTPTRSQHLLPLPKICTRSTLLYFADFFSTNI